MNDEKLRRQIGTNIAAYRKRGGWTQAELAEKLNYSDKAVSKWERGESVPDVLTLASLAECLNITVNDLLKDPNELPEHTGADGQVSAEKFYYLGNTGQYNIIASIHYFEVTGGLDD